MKIIGIGLGLIGGSMLLSLRQTVPDATFLGKDIADEHLTQAKDLGIIDETATDDDLKEADIVVVSIPVDIAVNEMKRILSRIGPETLVLDTGSTKGNICEQLTDHPKRDQFLATHPIAGTEFSGPGAAFKGLFTDKTMIICEIEKTRFKLQQRAIDLFGQMQMNIRYMNPKEHDQHIAYVSHLSHISSFMLGKTVIDKEKDERDIFDLAGSGFASTVRLAKSNPKTWTSIFKDNRVEVKQALDHYIKHLQSFQQALVQEEYDQLYTEMDNTNRLKDILKGITL
ncbi:MAG: prephenate dehydrogenase [Psychroflexus sp.]|nr:prephenate dehydrogenase [Psychroflexus sp.]